MSDETTFDPVAIIRQYHKKQVAHLKLTDAFDSLLWIINQEPENVEELYLLVGPSGCGKSTLLKRLEAYILDRYKTEMAADPGMIPVIYVQLAAPQDGNFNWKDFFSRLLEKFNDVLIKKKVILHPEAVLNGEIISTIRFLVREELRRAVRNAFVFRKTKYLLLDESGHLLMTKTAIPARIQFEIIKSIAQELHIPIILAGDYTLLGILELNGQLTRRTEVVHFSRYSTSEVSDPQNLHGKAFKNTVFSLLEAMPIPKEDGLIGHMDYFYQNSLGTIGLLKKWFKRALWKAMMSEQRILTRAVLETTRWRNKSLKLLITETKKGEAQLQDITDDEIARELGLEITPSIDVITENFRSAEDQEETAAKKPKRGQKRPGARGRSRDPVGGVPHAA